MSKVGAEPTKRKAAHKYSELEGEEIDDDMIKGVKDKKPNPGKMHAFDAV